MNEQQYYEEIEHLIKKHEVSKRVRSLEENNDLWPGNMFQKNV